jgi:hypothetical protein
MDDTVELQWRYLKDNLDHSRHHETLRATATNIVVAVAGAGFSVVGYDKGVSASDVPLLVFLVVLGVFGAVFSAKQTERASLHYARARELRDAIDESPHAPRFKELKKIADDKNDARFPHLSRLELRRFWLLLHLSVSAIALVLLAWVMSRAH